MAYPITLPLLAKRYPNTSFVRGVPLSTYADFGVVEVKVAPKPDYDPETTQASLNDPVEVEGKWFQKWETSPIPVAQLEEKQNQKEQSVRTTRNQLLSSSDWTQLEDSPLSEDAKTEWALYREALRAVPEQDGFPDSVEWPVAPNS